MADDRDVLLYHAPHTRSSGVVLLLEELGVPYRLQVLDFPAGEHRKPDYLAVNPMGKVPALRHGDALVTEQVAIYIYLADLFPERGLAPAIGDALRGPYLRWLVFYAASFEPAMADRAQQRGPGPAAMSPYGDFDTVLNTLAEQLRQGPWLLGDRFTAVDPLWGSALAWAVAAGLVPERPEFTNYLQHFSARPAVARARAVDEAQRA
jgi:glutathione S-transferase